ncbi:glycoside hydrolase [Lipomyces kononenkoae]
MAQNSLLRIFFCLLLGLTVVVGSLYDDFDDFDLEDSVDPTARLLLAEHARASNVSLQWGPYRSNLYLGIRPRGLPKTFLSGLMWYNVDNYQNIHKIRHSCEQGDEMQGYGWDRYDVRDGGRQVIHDIGHDVDIYTEFVKDGGSSWGLRVRGVPKNKDAKTAMVFYFGTEGIARSKLLNNFDLKGFTDDVQYGGYIGGLGNFKLTVTRGPESNRAPANDHAVAISRPAERTHVRSVTVDGSTIWRARDYYLKIMQDFVQKMQGVYPVEQLPSAAHLFNLNDAPDEGNLHFVQRNFVGEFQFDVLFEDVDGESMNSAKLTGLLDSAISTFDDRYAKVFAHSEPFDSHEYVSFGKSLVSNLLGGIGYFHGSGLVDMSDSAYDDEEYEDFWVDRGPANVVETEPSELFSAVPSRPFFPRGFYWDEGFHLIPIIRWDPDLAVEIMKSWFNLADAEGWIAREQILGHEARSKVPPEFQTQYPNYANPPTLMLAMSAFVDAVESHTIPEGISVPVGDDMPQQFINFPDTSARNAYLHSPALARAALKSLYPSLRTHFNWFRRTQSADIRSWHNADTPRPASWTEGYRWRGRTPDHCLTSGLDDYPRARQPHPAEMHVDLMAWVGAMTSAMIKVGKFTGAPETDITRYEQILAGVKGNLEEMHWNEDAGAYCDLRWDPETEGRTHECHEGYATLLPFMMGLVPVDKVGKIVRGLRDPDRLWSNFGIRSLSKRDPAFGQGENYWRGSIWINMNYMVLGALKSYYEQSDGMTEEDVGMIADAYKRLRVNLVSNVHKQWEATGFAWEQYEQETGNAKGVKHFLGWTSLVAVIMSMPEVLE